VYIDPVVSWTIALSVAALFAVAAAHKLGDWTKFGEAVRNYQLLPRRVVPFAAAMVTALELGAALLILIAATRPFGALLAAGLLAGYATAMAINLARGRVHLDCGCLGVGQRQAVRWWMVGRNLAIAALALLAGQPLVARELTLLDADTVVCTAVTLAILYTAQNVLGASARPQTR
jgi:hypothetical protein